MQREFTDQLQRHISVAWPPQRIISLVPSQTELLFDLGLGDRVVGVTDFCTEPAAQIAQCVRVGGTKRFRFDRIDALAPDLVVANREENYVEGIARLAQRYPVWVSDILGLDNALAMIAAIGELGDCADRAGALHSEISRGFATLRPLDVISCAYLIWKKPWMVAAANTFIDDMLRRGGFGNVFADRERYPEITIDELRERQPRRVLLSSEPFPFTAEHVAELAAELPDCRVHYVDAMPFSWYGSRLRHTPACLLALRTDPAVSPALG